MGMKSKIRVELRGWAMGSEKLLLGEEDNNQSHSFEG
jgi:hypothetical protein